MSPKFPLTVAEKQKILYLNPNSPQEMVEWGNRYREAGLWHDALEFYAAAKDAPSLEAVVRAAGEQGDLILLLNACRAQGVPPPAGALTAVRDGAKALGKEAEARRADLLLVPSR
jgi:hypothetical protein